MLAHGGIGGRADSLFSVTSFTKNKKKSELSFGLAVGWDAQVFALCKDGFDIRAASPEECHQCGSGDVLPTLSSESVSPYLLNQK